MPIGQTSHCTAGASSFVSTINRILSLHIHCPVCVVVDGQHELDASKTCSLIVRTTLPAVLVPLADMLLRSYQLSRHTVTLVPGIREDTVERQTCPRRLISMPDNSPPP